MTVMAAVMVSGLVSLSLAGDYVYFGAMNAQINGPAMLLAAPLAGVIGGLMGGIFARVLVMFAWSRANWLTPVRAHPVLFAGLCGVIVAVTGYLSGGLSWGTGYGTTKALLTGQTAPLAFAPAKLIATTATALSGAPGGIFAPSLSVGAGLGQWMALAVQAIFPGVPSARSSCSALPAISPASPAPLTAVIIVMEMSADRGMILPLMATALVADTVSTMVCRRKLYHAQSLQFR
jgi:H+/Cl- antiporter ClcA